jgi:hypothetical protein
MKRPVDIVRKDGTTTIRYGMRKDGDVNYLGEVPVPRHVVSTLCVYLYV